MLLTAAPNFGPVNIEGVMVSIHPDLLVTSGERVGAGMLRVAKRFDAEACKLDVTKLRKGEQRRELNRYLIALMQLWLEAQAGAHGTPDPDLCFVADVR